MSWSEARTSRHVTGWDAGAAGVGLPGLPQLRACGPGLHIGECREVHLVAQEAHARGYVRVAQQLGVTQAAALPQDCAGRTSRERGPEIQQALEQLPLATRDAAGVVVLVSVRPARVRFGLHLAGVGNEGVVAGDQDQPLRAALHTPASLARACAPPRRILHAEDLDFASGP